MLAYNFYSLKRASKRNKTKLYFDVEYRYLIKNKGSTKVHFTAWLTID